MIQSVDFITPVVDDPYTYGEIAAANSLSDLFAQGCEALSALNLLMWDKCNVDEESVKEILSGGFSKINEAKAVLLGGHSIIDCEQKYGLSVSGVVKDGVFWRNNTPSINDDLILTKPLGSGIIITGLKNGKLNLSAHSDCINSMRTLNLKSMRIAKKYKISACTDITGYGFIGHLLEMLNGNKPLKAELDLNSFEFFDGVKKALSEGIFPGGSAINLKATKDFVCFDEDNLKAKILFDAQTSGGLLFAIDKKQSLKLLEELQGEGIKARIVGEILQGEEFSKKININ